MYKQQGLVMFSSRFFKLTRTTLAASLAMLCAVHAAPAFAGPFSVSPVRIYMGTRDRATAITITNEGDEELVMQADLYSWKQKPNGEDDLVLTEDMILSPPIIKIAPKSRQVVRLAMLRPRPPGEQLTYRMIVREIPEAKSVVDKNLQLNISLAFSMPVFITPNGVKRNLSCVTERAEAAGTIKAVCENTGNAYAQPRKLVLNSAAGEKLAGVDMGGYILPGNKRSFDLVDSNGKVAAGKAKLVVTQDDNVPQTFEVNVTE